MIDVHTHVFSPYAIDHRQDLVSGDSSFASIYSDKKARMVEAVDLLRAMDEQGVEASVMCGFPWTGLEDCRRENDYLLACALRHSGRLVPFVSLPKPPEEALHELKRCLEEGARGVGEWAPGTYGDELWDADLIEMMAGAVREACIPLMVHVNEPLGHCYPGKGKLSLRELERLVSILQGLPVILAHMGGGLLFFELMPEISRLSENLYYDTAAAPLLYDQRIYRTALSILGPGRLLLGSDYPLLSPERYTSEMREGGLTTDEIDRITRLDPARLLGLNP